MLSPTELRLNQMHRVFSILRRAAESAFDQDLKNMESKEEEQKNWSTLSF